jgi:hypothetical protein
VATDHTLAILREIRKMRPDVFIQLGDGFPLSPWWLTEADALWRGDGDYGFADRPREAPRRELFVTFVDSILYREWVRKGRQVPLHAVSTGAVVHGRLSNDLPESHGTVGERDEFMAVWERMVVMEAARGTLSEALHLSYAVVTRDQWTFLTRWLAWSAEKADLLSRGGMTGGDPGKEEPYAFIHGAAGRAILAIRNPSDTEKDLVLRMDSGLLRFGERPSLQWKTVYPYAESGVLDANAPWTLRLNPFEVRVVEVWGREP